MTELTSNEAKQRFRQAVLDMRDVVRHGNLNVLDRHTDDALDFGDAYADARVAEAQSEEIARLQEALSRLHDAADDHNAAKHDPSEHLCVYCKSDAIDGREGIIHKDTCPLLLARIALALKEGEG